MPDRVQVGGRSLRTNTIWALVAEAVQLVVGSAVFFLLVDRLGPVEAGYYGAALAIATFALPISAIGAQALMMREMAGGGDLKVVWSRSISTVALGGTAATVLAALVHRWLLPEVPVWAFALLIFSQVVLFAIAEFGLVAAQARRRLEVGALIRISTGVCRLMAVGCFFRFGEPTVASWSIYGVVAVAIAALSSLLIVRRAFGAGPVGTFPSRSSLSDGIPFAFGSSSARALDSLDRPMLVRLGPASDAGVYNVGYRLIQMALTPVSALVRASEADIFTAGTTSTARAFAVARRMSARASGYAVLAGVAMVLLAPLVPLALGDEWVEVVDVIRLLAPLPLIKALQVFPANALTGSGRQIVRNQVLFAAIGLNAGLNLWLIPSMGWSGAAIATLVAESAMVLGLWTFLLQQPDE